MKTLHLVLTLAFLATTAQAQGTRLTPEAATSLIHEATSVRVLVAEGKLLYDATPFSRQRTWGQYCNDAWVLNDRGEFRRAIHAASMALYLGEKQGDDAALAFAKRDLAVSYSYSGNLDAAERFASESVTYQGQHVRDIYSVSYKTLGDVKLRRGDHSQAIEHYKKALSYSTYSWARLTRVALANSYIAAGDLGSARTVLEEARSFSSSPEKEMAWRAWGNYLIAANKPDEAMIEFRRYGAAADGEDGAYQRVWGLEGEARAKGMKGDSTGAKEALLKAMTEAEGVRAKFRSEEFRAGVFGELQDVFTRSAFVLADSGDAEAALEAAERGRARALLDQVRDRVRSGSLSRQAASVPALSTVDIARTIDSKETLVAFLIGTERSLAWVVSSGSVKAVPIAAGRSRLAGSVRAFRAALLGRLPTARDHAKGLYELLIKPLGISDPGQLVLVPHDVLHHLPFQALWDGERYLIEAASITYAPSASTHAHLISKRTSSKARRVLAFGNPDLGDPSMALPGAEREVNNIKIALPDSRIYVQGEATKSRFLADAEKYSIVHIAAHAEFDPVDPLYSRVKLALGNIEAHEIYKLRLDDSSLVALSACESGMTGVTRGDEIWGFTRSLFAAGASAALLSLWPVSDESTEMLMTEFYRGTLTKSFRNSLREAQLKLLREKQFAHPYYWAAFNLNGDGR